MSNVLNDASLILIPSGYKAGKLYSQIPDSGAGDLSFTRSLDTATRVGSDGLIEKVRTNLLLRSEELDNASWGKSVVGINTLIGTSGIEANVAVAPDGTTTADRVNFINQADTDLGLFQTVNISASTTYSSSFYLKGEGTDIGKQVRIKMKRASAGTSVATVNTVTLTADWVRVPTTLTMAANNVDLQVIISSAVGGAVTCLLWGAQLETGSVATPYIPTTTAAVSVGMLANVPRLDYLGGGCPKLLLEPQRTNLALFSEQLNNAVWVKQTATTILSNVTTSPAGFLDADKLVNSTSVNRQAIYQDSSATGVLSFSVFAKKAEYDVIQLTDGREPTFFANFDLTNGVLGSFVGYTASIQDYGNGWYRCAVSANYAALTINQPRISLAQTATETRLVEFAGSGTDGVFLYGAQLEVGSFATSYIPTLGAAVTRSADAASKTGISALIGQTEGTLFADFKLDGSRTSVVIAEITDGTTSNAVISQYTSSGLLQVVLNSGGTTHVNIIGPASAAGSYKLAIAYKLNNVAVYLNGASVGTDTSATMPVSMSRLDIAQRSSGALQFGGAVNQALLFKTRLTNTQLEELTTI